MSVTRIASKWARHCWCPACHCCCLPTRCPPKIPLRPIPIRALNRLARSAALPCSKPENVNVIEPMRSLVARHATRRSDSNSLNPNSTRYCARSASCGRRSGVCRVIRDPAMTRGDRIPVADVVVPMASALTATDLRLSHLSDHVPVLCHLVLDFGTRRSDLGRRLHHPFKASRRAVLSTSTR